MIDGRPDRPFVALTRKELLIAHAIAADPRRSYAVLAVVVGLKQARTARWHVNGIFSKLPLQIGIAAKRRVGLWAISEDGLAYLAEHPVSTGLEKKNLTPVMGGEAGNTEVAHHAAA